MKIVKYILAVLLLIGSLGVITKGDVFSGLIIILLVVMITPVVSEKLKKQFSLFENRFLRYGIYLLLFFIAGTFLSKSEAEEFGSKESVLVNYIKKGEYDTSLKNIAILTKIGEMFGNNNYSLEHPKDGYIIERYDSVKKAAILIFNPNFRYIESDDISFLKVDIKNGRLKDYSIQYEVYRNDSIAHKKTTMVFTKATKEFLNVNEVPSVNSFINKEIIEKQEKVVAYQRKIKEQEAIARKQMEAYNKRAKKFEKDCLSSWDGSHIMFARKVKESLNDPSSFKHVTTTYRLIKDYAIVNMTFRGKNAFNATITNKISARIKLSDCSVVEILN